MRTTTNTEISQRIINDYTTINIPLKRNNHPTLQKLKKDKTHSSSNSLLNVSANWTMTIPDI